MRSAAVLLVLLATLVACNAVPLSRVVSRLHRGPKGEQKASGPAAGATGCPDLKTTVEDMRALSKAACIPKPMHPSVSFVGGALEAALNLQDAKIETPDHLAALNEGLKDTIKTVADLAKATPTTPGNGKSLGGQCDVLVPKVKAAASGFMTGNCLKALKLPAPMPELFKAASKALIGGSFESLSNKLSPAIDGTIKRIPEIPAAMAKIQAFVALTSMRRVRVRDIPVFVEERDTLVALDRAENLEEARAILSKTKHKGWTHIFQDSKTWADNICPKRTADDFKKFQEAMTKTNGCTTFGIPVPFTQKTLVDSCQIHDFGYICGMKHGVTRSQSDDLFWSNNMRQCAARYYRPYWHAVKRGLCYAFGSAAAATVKAVGKLRFTSKDFGAYCDSHCSTVMSSWLLANFDDNKIVDDKPVPDAPVVPPGKFRCVRITVVSVSGAAKADWVGKSELYVQLMFTMNGKQKKGPKTDDVKGKSSATWNTELGVPPAATGLTVELKDEDWIHDDTLSTAALPATQLVSDVAGTKDFTIELPNKKNKAKPAKLVYKLHYA